MFYYRPQRSWGKVMFLQVSVILFTEGESASVHAGITPPPRGRNQEDPPPSRPPRSGTPQEENPPPPEQAPPPPGRDPPGAETIPPRKQCMQGRYGQQAGGTHPTGMHACFPYISSNKLQCCVCGFFDKWTSTNQVKQVL